jgi:hypothetical protein
MKNDFAIERTVYKMIENQAESGRTAVRSASKLTDKELFLLTVALRHSLKASDFLK